MNKKLLAVALATAFAAPAMAEGVTIYGAFDVGVLSRGGNEGKVVDTRDYRTTVASGMNGHNFIGFKMSEDLGNGLTVSGDAQFGFSLDSSQAYVSATSNDSGGAFRTITSTLALSGDFGTVVAGKTGGARAAWIKKYDPFGGFGVAGQLSTTGLGGGEAYANNVIAWVTPEILPGLRGLAAYTSSLDQQDWAGTKTAPAGRLYAFAAMYDSGPVSFVLNYENLEHEATADKTGNPAIYTAGASYDFGMVKVYGLYDLITKYGQGWQVGVSSPVTNQLTLKAGYSTGTRHGYLSPNGVSAPEANEGDNKCSKVGVGLTYALSKRTSFYADAATMTEAKREGCGISVNGDSIGNSGTSSDAASHYGATGFDAGIRHTF